MNYNVRSVYSWASFLEFITQLRCQVSDFQSSAFVSNLNTFAGKAQIVAYFLKTKPVEADKQPLPGNGPYTRSRGTFHVRCDARNRRAVFSMTALRSLLCNGAVTTFLQQ
jgi:hypothetical protein